MPPFHITVLPGDGTGPEVIAVGLDVLRAVTARLEGVQFEFEELYKDFNGSSPCPAARQP